MAGIWRLERSVNNCLIDCKWYLLPCDVSVTTVFWDGKELFLLININVMDCNLYVKMPLFFCFFIIIRQSLLSRICPLRSYGKELFIFISFVVVDRLYICEKCFLFCFFIIHRQIYTLEFLHYEAIFEFQSKNWLIYQHL